MLITFFSISCFVFTALAASLISSRVVAQELLSPISPPLLLTKVDTLSVGDIPTVDFSVSLDLPTAIPVSGISGVNPWSINPQLLARADLLYWRSLSLFRSQNLPLLDSQELEPSLLAESVSSVGDAPNILLASDALVNLSQKPEVMGDSAPVMEVSQTNGVNPEDVMPGVPTNTNTELEPETSNPQDVDELIRAIRNSVADKEGAISPALTVLTPIGFGGYLGSVSIGGAYQSRTRNGNNDDGNASVSISLGNPKDWVGLDLTWNIQGLSDSHGAPNNFGDGTLGLQISRLVSDDLSIGLGVENFARFSGRNVSNFQSYYLVATKIFTLDEDLTQPFSVLYTSIGSGTGRFLSTETVDLYGGNGVNVFGSAAIQVVQGINGIFEWSGKDIDIGLSFVPFRDFPLVITPAVVDITGNAGDGARFVITANIGLFF